MAVSPGFRTLVVDQLSRVLPTVRTRAMFGGVGIYAGDLFFALIDDDTLYLKVDDTNRADFEALGMGPFRFGDGTEVMQYYHLPEDVLEDAEALQPWIDKAVAVAASKKKKKSKRRKASE